MNEVTAYEIYNTAYGVSGGNCTDKDLEVLCRDWLRTRGHLVQSKNDWRTAPPDKPGWWWGYSDGVVYPYNIFDSPDGSCLHVFRPIRHSIPVSELSCQMWLKAEYPTPPDTIGPV